MGAADRVGILKGSDGGKIGQLGGDGGLVDVITDPHAEAGDEAGVVVGGGGDGPLVLLGQGALEETKDAVGHRAGVLDAGVAAGELGRDVALVGAEDEERTGRAMLLEVGEDAGHLLGSDLAIDQAQPEKLTGELLRLLVVGGHVGSGQMTVSSLAAASL